MEQTITLEALVQQQPKLADKKLIVATAWLMEASDNANDLEYLCARLNSLSAGIEVAIRALSEPTITRPHQEKFRKLLAGSVRQMADITVEVEEEFVSA